MQMKYLFINKLIIMKKIVFLALILGAILSTNAYAQPAADPQTVLQQMKEKQKPGLIEKVGLTEAQADKVIEINYETRMQAARELKDLNEADRSKKIAELKEAKEKKFSEFLTPEQIKAMYAYYEEMGKQMPKKPAN
jgi:Spy/CpxP family protein refolding chaperone